MRNIIHKHTSFLDIILGMKKTDEFFFDVNNPY